MITSNLTERATRRYSKLARDLFFISPSCIFIYCSYATNMFNTNIPQDNRRERFAQIRKEKNWAERWRRSFWQEAKTTKTAAAAACFSFYWLGRANKGSVLEMEREKRGIGLERHMHGWHTYGMQVLRFGGQRKTRHNEENHNGISAREARERGGETRRRKSV